MGSSARFLLAIALSTQGAAAAKARADNFLKAGVSLGSHHAALHTQMRQMMGTTGEDDVDFHSLHRDGRDTSKRGTLRANAGKGTASLEDYIKEAEDGLSAALGPRWNARVLEEDADRQTAALLRGISGPRAMGAIHRMMGALGR
mmetsp:Transcript_52594/g.122411  ORF Transcript_52594/g.122411 Transcript_52594/m.122411 type:complete len:145 (-) Transcript_52594:87-521(-)|eukprot:CAMPEP_0171098278 /NCGR_PEP_ID=MMETSP0766_2-20121228/48031_1 /TAXON_ID=439317 /ORGANISM="Gambierdiscus australes, Strain CAWD 149" /LENGTH=144 /DNA_ID=CAMNT_0011557601 /DNA_START=76 /DNA_END=510 /DNA_ORIENTATION=-